MAANRPAISNWSQRGDSGQRSTYLHTNTYARYVYTDVRNICTYKVFKHEYIHTYAHALLRSL